MIVDFLVLLWLLALVVPLYWATPERWRLGVLFIASLALLWTLSPVIPITLFLYGVLIWSFAKLQDAGASLELLRSASWVAFLPLLLLEWLPQELIIAGILGQSALNATALIGFAFLGVSYSAIRSFILIRERFNATGARPIEKAACLTFFGSFLAGPIAGGQPWRDTKAKLTLRDMIVGASRIFWGAALLLAIKPIVEGADLSALFGLAEESRALAWLSMYRSFFVLYIDFAGYTDVAIGSALLFGVRLPENFNWPLRATSIQEFWQRWHMSLGAFIGTYLFKPFVRTAGKPTYAIFLSFIFVGLWHTISVPYFLWGVGHGTALAINMVVRKRYGAAVNAAPGALRFALKLLGWAFTMSYVSFLSSFATQPDIRLALAFAAGLF